MLIGLAGRKRVGKDTIADYMTEKHAFVKTSPADVLRRMLEKLDPNVEVQVEQSYLDVESGVMKTQTGKQYPKLTQILQKMSWDEAKDRFPEVVRLQQQLGSEGVRDQLGEDVLVEAVDRGVRALAELGFRDVVHTSVRFGNEARWIRERGGRVWLISRPDVEYAGVVDLSKHRTESLAEVMPYVTDRINNDSTFDALYETVEKLIGEGHPSGRTQ